MQNANLSQEISRLYEELSDHILARDGEGASRIYQELLRAGQSSEMLAARVTAIQNTPELELFRQANEQGSRSPDGPPQGSAEPAFAGGTPRPASKGPKTGNRKPILRVLHGFCG